MKRSKGEVGEGEGDSGLGSSPLPTPHTHTPVRVFSFQSCLLNYFLCWSFIQSTLDFPSSQPQPLPKHVLVRSEEWKTFLRRGLASHLLPLAGTEQKACDQLGQTWVQSPAMPLSSHVSPGSHFSSLSFWPCTSKFFFFNIYSFLRQRETEHEWGKVREGDTESETGSRL